jgi:hypothetical protein
MRLPAALGLAVVALLILAVAVVASWQNYQVIAETFQSMHGRARGDGPSIAIVMGEFIAGLFMVEAFGWSHLLPFMRSMSHAKRICLGALAVLGFLTVCGMEMGLAIERAKFVTDKLATAQLLRGEKVTVSVDWIDLGTQCSLGFFLPVVSLLATLAAELFEQAVRTVGVRLWAARLRRKEGKALVAEAT